MTVKDTRIRLLRNEKGTKDTYRLRRLRCNDCSKIHMELPDLMHPYKQYASSVIEAALDETRNDCPADDSTIHRWKAEYRKLRQALEGALISLWIQFHKRQYPLLDKNSLLDKIAGDGPGWLTRVTKVLVNAGLSPHTQFACCPP